MKIEKDGMLPFLGTQLLNHAPQIETTVYVKPTNTGLFLHYPSHVALSLVPFVLFMALLFVGV